MIGDQQNQTEILSEEHDDTPAIPRIPPMIALSAKIFNERITVKFTRKNYEIKKNQHYTSVTSIKNDYRVVVSESASNISSDTENRPNNCCRVEEDTSSSCDSEEMPPRSKSPNFTMITTNSPGSSESENKFSSKESIECEYCTKTYTKLKRYNKHKKRHISRKSFGCKLCDKIFPSRPSWSYHQKSVHTLAKDFICDYCQKGFVTKQHLQSHIKNHKYICHFCLKPFTARYKLREHKEIHRILQCDFCDRAFFRQHRLDRHIELKHPQSDIQVPCFKDEPEEMESDEEPPTPCNEECKHCGRIFPSKDDLQHHWKVTGENLYICAHCLEICEDELAFSHHLLKHSEEKVFVCTLCSKTFVTMDLLEDHFGTHSGLSN